MSRFRFTFSPLVRNTRFACVMGLLLAAGASHAEQPATSVRLKQAEGTLPPLPLFLDLFAATHRITVRTEPASWTGVTGKQTGFFARREAAVPLPGLIIIPDGNNSSAWYKNTAKELAGIGYAVLLLRIDSERINTSPIVTKNNTDAATNRAKTLADLSSAVGWLRRHTKVDADRIGVLGWSRAAAWAVELAADQGLQGCVMIHGFAQPDAVTLSALRRTRTGVMDVRTRMSLIEEAQHATFTNQLKSASVTHKVFVFNEAPVGFMNPELKTSYRSEEAEKAWFETYEFLEGQVEAAAEKFAVASTAAPIAEEKHAATIAELMRVINAPTGVRGDLARLLADKPANAGIWKQVRAHAVVMTETGTRLQSHIPTRGKRTSWRKYAGEYRNLAASLVAAADRRDYGSVQKLLGRIADSCGACHLEHR